MHSFDEIFAMAADRKGGAEVVMAGITPPLTAEALAAIPDDRWLAGMTRAVFNAGFNWKVISAKWPGFEEAFEGFHPVNAAMMSDERFDELLADKRVVRNGAKIASVRDNAVFITEVAKEAGSFGRKVAEWPSEDFAGLIRWLGKEGSRLGGATAQYFLRAMGKDGWILSQDVIARLVAEGVVTKDPTSQRDMAAVQAAFTGWSEESGQPLTVISRVLAQSIGATGGGHRAA